MQTVDLHVHSNRSDGTFTPAQLVNYAMEKGLAAFALTDHDTIDGVEEALQYAAALQLSASGVTAAGFTPGANAVTAADFNSENNDITTDGFNPMDQSLAPAASVTDLSAASVAGLPAVSSCLVPEIIPGIELSTEYHGQDVHIVGLYINHKDPALLRHLKAFVDSRDQRNRKMCRLLTQAGIPVTYEALQAEFPNAVITRAHYAKYMLNHGYIRTLKEAFDRYVGDQCPCYVPREKVTPAQAVQLILQAGGVPILAHPTLYHMDDSQLEQLILELKVAGLAGIEAIYSTYTEAEERHIRTLAAKHGLLISGGSDFHGANKPGLDLATGYGKLFIPYSVLKTIKETLSAPC